MPDVGTVFATPTVRCVGFDGMISTLTTGKSNDLDVNRKIL